MYKYRSVLLWAGILSIMNLCYTMLVFEDVTLSTSIYVRILHDYTYVFFFTVILFINLTGSGNQLMIISRSCSLNRYLIFEIKEKLKRYGVLFMAFTAFQIVLFAVFDKQFAVMTLLYRNFVFYVFINIVHLMVIIGSSKRKSCRSILMFVFWNLSYFISILMPDSSLNQINIFTVLQKPDLAELFRYSVLLLIVIVVCMMRVSNKRRYIAKWLD